MCCFKLKQENDPAAILQISLIGNPDSICVCYQRHCKVSISACSLAQIRCHIKMIFVSEAVLDFSVKESLVNSLPGAIQKPNR